MIIGSISENKNLEKRVSITPEISKKYGWKYKTNLKKAILATYKDYSSEKNKKIIY